MRTPRWDTARLIRLALAAAFLLAGIASGDAFAYTAAAFLGVQAILNVGCCGSACQPVRTDPTASGLKEVVTYDEVR